MIKICLQVFFKKKNVKILFEGVIREPGRGAPLAVVHFRDPYRNKIIVIFLSFVTALLENGLMLDGLKPVAEINI